jgi:hypothetical protein
VPASSTDGFESVVVVPPKRDVEARLGQYREFQRSDGIRLLGLRDSLNHVCLVVAPVEGPFIRVAHAREIVDSVYGIFESIQWWLFPRARRNC